MPLILIATTYDTVGPRWVAATFAVVVALGVLLLWTARVWRTPPAPTLPDRRALPSRRETPSPARVVVTGDRLRPDAAGADPVEGGPDRWPGLGAALSPTKSSPALYPTVAPSDPDRLRLGGDGEDRVAIFLHP